MSDIVRIRPTRFIFVDYTAREATSLPYSGWAIVSAWYAGTIPCTTQESWLMHKPGAHWGSELRFKYQFAQLCNGCGVRSPRNSKKISDTRMGIRCFRRRMRDSISSRKPPVFELATAAPQKGCFSFSQRMRDSIESRKPPVFELVAAAPHWGAAPKWVRIPHTAKKYQIPGWVSDIFGRG